MKIGQVLSCGHGLLDFSVHSLLTVLVFFFSEHFPFPNVNECVPHRKGKVRIPFLGLNDASKIIFLTQQFGEIGFRKKIKKTVTLFLVTRLRGLLTTHRERFAITFWKGKNSSKGLNFNRNEEKPPKVLIVASFKGDDEKAQQASVKNIFI